MASALHELLAVERDLQTVSNKMLDESLKTMGKESLFKGQTRTLKHFADSDQHLNLSEHQELETTVDEKLEYFKNHWAKWVDVTAMIDDGNMKANSDVIVKGVTILHNVSAMTLLGLESKLNKLRSLFLALPTLPAGTSWVGDENERAGIYKTQFPVTTIKEIKEEVFKTVSPATDRHPAQVVKVMDTAQVGKYESSAVCGMISARDKADLLGNLDLLLAAIKTARARANTQQVEKINIGHEIFNFILDN